MAVKTFNGTVHKFLLKGEARFVVDPATIPAGIRDELCQRHNYWLDSRIGPNHKVAHYDMHRQDWRDMRNAFKVETYENRSIAYTDIGTLFWS